MVDTRDICVNCFARRGHSRECPRCGYVDGTPQILPYLEPGTVLADRYLVGKRRWANGEGAAYLGLDIETGRKLTVREFLPPTLCDRGETSDEIVVNDGDELVFRDYMNEFIDIQRAVSRMSDVPAIVQVLDIFECNNTVYAIYERVDGRPMSEIVRKADRLSWEEARPLFLPLISAMVSAHAIGLVHYGINPECVYLTKEGKLRIEGFGIPDARLAETELKAEINDGYSAIEQYSLEGRKGKAIDVYSMCALIFFTLTGRRPPDAVTRAYEPRLNIPAELAGTIPTHVVTALAGGLQVSAEQRTQTMEELKSQLAVKSVQGAQGVGVARRSEVRPPVQADGRRGFDSVRRSAAKTAARGVSALANLSPIQYGLLSAGIATVVLGILAAIILNGINASVNADEKQGLNLSSTQFYHSSTDISVDNELTLYEVPSLLGVKLTAAQKEEKYSMFDILCIEENFSDDYDEGEIISQTVEAKKMVVEKTPIGVVVSLGKKTRKIPKIIGKTIAEADKMLTDAGLVLGAQTEEYSSEYDAGCVISIVGSKVGSKLEYGSSVDVKVSKGKEPEVSVVD